VEETVIWVTGLIAEILLAVTVLLAVRLRRSRKVQQQLLIRLADQEKHPAARVVAAEIPSETSAEVRDTPVIEIELPQDESVVVEAIELDLPAAQAAPAIGAAMVEALPLDAPQIDPLEITAEPPKTTDASVTNAFDQLLASIDDAELDEPVERLQQRLQATGQSLQRLAAELQLESTGSVQGYIEFASLQANLQEMTKDVDSLQQSNAQLKQDLRGKTQAMERTAAEARENREIVLQHAKKLRGDIVMLRDKLKNSEGDVQRLQSEKEALAAEYAALNKEYERIYSSTPK
jgi:DNA repair exonuclease SbcCD ATPase subunit